ncbi:hypothetical protein [Rosistilla oblonga]|uniref:hypothetical protein n=1 Tax=Rosistilla oblonga TaxID=2527990 RepID=UPI003A97F4EB
MNKPNNDAATSVQSVVTGRRKWWIDNPPWCWKGCLVSTFDGATGPSQIEDEDGSLVDGERVEVVEARSDDPDFDAVLAAIDEPKPTEINEKTYAEAAAWIMNVMRARCHTGKLSSR